MTFVGLSFFTISKDGISHYWTGIIYERTADMLFLITTNAKRKTKKNEKQKKQERGGNKRVNKNKKAK